MWACSSSVIQIRAARVRASPLAYLSSAFRVMFVSPSANQVWLGLSHFRAWVGSFVHTKFLACSSQNPSASCAAWSMSACGSYWRRSTTLLGVGMRWGWAG